MQLEEGESRLELGVHYKIPYPRLHHAPQLKYIEKPKVDFGQVPRARDDSVNAKLEAAIKRKQQVPLTTFLAKSGSGNRHC